MAAYETIRFSAHCTRTYSCLSEVAGGGRGPARAPKPQFQAALPVNEKRADIAALIERHQVVIVCGETGSGKTTQLPKVCLELGRGAHGLIDAVEETLFTRASKIRIWEYCVTSFCTPDKSVPEAQEQGQKYGLFSLVGEVGYSCDSREILESHIAPISQLKVFLEESPYFWEQNVGAIQELLMRCYPFCKNWGFAEEPEVHLIAVVSGSQIFVRAATLKSRGYLNNPWFLRGLS